VNPFLTCSPLPHPLHRSAIRSPHRQSHCRPVWAIYAVLKPSSIRVPLLISARTKQRRSSLLIAVSLLRSLRRVRDRRMSLRRPGSPSLHRASTSIISSEVFGGKV